MVTIQLVDELWNRGQGNRNGFMYRDGKLDCLGFLLVQHGMDRTVIDGMRSPRQIERFLSEELKGLFLVTDEDGYYDDSDFVGTILEVNDDQHLGDEARVHQINEACMEKGFSFVLA